MLSHRIRIGLIGICLCLSAITTHHFRAHAMGHYLSTQRYEDVYYLPPAEWLPVFSLGYKKALSDLIWMKALIYFGEELIQQGNVRYLFHYAEAMLSLDKYFRAVYRWVAISALYRTGEVTEKDARKAIGFLERGIRLFPDDGALAWDLGATYVYELVPLLKDKEERNKARKLGLPYLESAALRGAGPKWLALSNASQLVKLGQTQQAIRHLETLYSTTYDTEKRELIEKRLAILRNQAYVEAMKHTLEEYRKAHQRDFPYLSSTLYLLVGPRPPFDSKGFLERNFDPLADVVIEDENGI